MKAITTVQTNRIGKRGTWVVPVNLRHLYGLEEGVLVIAEPRPDGILLKPAIASATLPDFSVQGNAWRDWFSLMGEIKASPDEISEARTQGKR